MTEFDVLLTENHFLLSFMVVGAALLPPLLLLVPPPFLSQDNTGWLSQNTAWRGVSMLAAIPPLV
jgi:hypothetical protein